MNGSEIFHTHKNGIQNRLLSAHLMENPWKISKEGVIITYMRIYRKNKWFMYYLINEQECFIGFKTRGEAERFISDKAQTASF